MSLSFSHARIAFAPDAPLSSLGPKMTPMLQQYAAAKAEHPDALLFFRLGDFYELFGEDAVRAAKILNITLTQRGKGADATPMCGVPYHASNVYIKRLIQHNISIAICEQVETPEERQTNGNKGPLLRKVVRVITPATLIDDTFLEDANHRFLVTLVPYPSVSSKNANPQKNFVACACLDVAARRFTIETLETHHLGARLSLLQPAELITPQAFFESSLSLLQPYQSVIKAWPSIKFHPARAKQRTEDFYNVATFDGIETLTDTETAAVGAILDYVTMTGSVPAPLSDAAAQSKNQSHILPFPSRITAQEDVIIDAATRQNLDIDGSKNSLFAHLSSYVRTPSGLRLLQRRLASPTQRQDCLEKRLNHIRFFYQREALRTSILHHLIGNADPERALTRCLLGRALVKDVDTLRQSLKQGKACLEQLEKDASSFDTYEKPSFPSDLLEMLEHRLCPSLPPSFNDGFVIAPGVDKDLDHYRDLVEKGDTVVQELQARYQSSTGIHSLKIKTNNVLGIFWECPPSQKAHIPKHFEQKQTLTNALRYTSADLIAVFEDITSASEKMRAQELKLFHEIIEAICASQALIVSLLQYISKIDLACGMAELAVTQNYCCPVFHPRPHENLSIKGGRHPMLDGPTFTANNTHFSEIKRFSLLTGPNMAGKSTYLRQIALITFMAHCGLFVPATCVALPIIDRIFSRIGAGDDLAKGRSTFMVEMVETAHIVNHATSRSLVILDELGRGTSTYDGLAIAFAVIEHLEHVRCLALFATHYFELTDMCAELSGVFHQRMAIHEHSGDIVFLHKVEEGAADKSYGLHVAALAGLPSMLLMRAQSHLNSFQERGARLHTPIAACNAIKSIEKHEHDTSKNHAEPKAHSFERPSPNDLVPFASSQKHASPTVSAFNDTKSNVLELPLTLLSSPEPAHNSSSSSLYRLVKRLKKCRIQHMTPIQALLTLEKLVTEAEHISLKEDPLMPSFGAHKKQ